MHAGEVQVLTMSGTPHAVRDYLECTGQCFPTLNGGGLTLLGCQLALQLGLIARLPEVQEADLVEVAVQVGRPVVAAGAPD